MSTEEELLIAEVVVVYDFVPRAWRLVHWLAILEELELDWASVLTAVKNESEA